MQLIGQTVRHKFFGQGVIKDCSRDIVTVSFSKGDKRFIYPDAFAGFLTLKNRSAQNSINTLCSKRQEEEAAQKQALQEEQANRQRLQALKITPNSHAAFDIDLKDFNKIFSSGAVPTGCYLSGKSKGEPRIPGKLRPNSACLLTGHVPDTTEKERLILGAVMVRDDFRGDLCKNGIIECHDTYKIRLAPDKRMMYWDYFDRADFLPRWGGVAFKYFSGSTMQRILLDMKRTADAGDKAAFQSFYEYFCEINRLTE